MAVWELRGFGPCLSEWIATDPTPHMRNLAVQWALSRSVDPYLEATRVTNDGHPNRWIALVPVPPDCNDQVVAEYDIVEVEHAVECVGVTTIPASVLGNY